MFTTALKKPALLLDKEKCLKNIEFMHNKAKRYDLILRPHFKTHQSITIGEWFRQFGTEKITVSSISMAKYFANGGWKDICVAFPFNIHEIDEAKSLAKKIKLHLSVCSTETLKFIDHSSKEEFGIYIKTDMGSHRTGVNYDNSLEIEEMLEIIKKSKKLTFTGFLIHNGHTYKTRNNAEIISIHEESMFRMTELKKKYSSENSRLILSTGDTPSCSISENFSGFDEIRPGNYVFYDLTQCHIGSCKPSQVAVALAVPVVAKHKERNEIVVYGGAIHLSKEDILLDNGRRVWGQVVELDRNTAWSDPLPGVYVTGVSQEHGIIRCDDLFFNKTKIGDFLGILPVHSCLTADVMKGYISTEGKKIDHFSAFSAAY